MLPTVICISDEIRIPGRLIRRGQSERMKARAARQFVRWAGRRNPLEKSRGSDGVKYYTAQEIQRQYGRMAAMHCTHVCEMCKHEKKFDKPKMPASESVRIYDLV